MVSGMTTLVEAILLLADRGSTARYSGVDRNAAAVGAVLADLNLAGRITLDGANVQVLDSEPTGEPVADEVLATIAAAAPRKPAGWVTKLYWGFPNRVRDAMVRRGLLVRHTSRFLRARTYTAATVEPADEVRERLRTAVAAGRTSDPWTAELAGLVRALKLHKYALPDLPRAEAQRGIDAIAADTWTADAVAKAVHNNRIAILIALIPIFTTILLVVTR